MSDTPISDSRAVRWSDVKTDTWYVPRIHVRLLEKELAELRRFKAAALTLTTEQSILHVMKKMDAKK